MKYEIEKNVPMHNIEGKGRARKYPFDEMNVGDSLFEAGDFPQASFSRLYCAAQMFARRRKNGIKFSGRRVDGGVRVWRVE